MNEFMPIESFDAVYLVDLCEPLLQIARRRFAAKGWTNVHVIHSDACTFTLPGWPYGNLPVGCVSLVTLSYSLSMIPSYHQLLDRVEKMLDPHDGLVGVADFYAARKAAGLHEESIGGASRACSWLGHWFW
jgi:betaine lipid synthase